MYNLLWNHTNVDLRLKDYWIIKDVKQNMFGWGDNPFKIANENSNAFKDAFSGILPLRMKSIKTFHSWQDRNG
jgi:hypothetical protein